MSRRVPAPPLDLDAAWASIRDALDVVFVFPDDAAPAPSLSVTGWTTAYTAVFSWCTSRASVSASFQCKDHMAALYQQLEAYVAEVCARLRSRLEGAPRTALLDTYLALYGAFHAHVGVAARITAYLDRHHTARMRATGGGWLRGIDQGGKLPRSPKKYMKHAQQALVHMFELAPDAAPDSTAWKEAEARAEAGSDLDRVPPVGVQALCLRRWRLDILEPLLLEHPELLPSISSATEEDRAALERLARSLKEIWLRAKDLRRTALAQLLQTE